MAQAFLKAEPVEGEIIVLDAEKVVEADYNLSPSRWVGNQEKETIRDIPSLLLELKAITSEITQNHTETAPFVVLYSPMTSWRQTTIGDEIELLYGKPLSAEQRVEGQFAVYGSNGVVGSQATQHWSMGSS